MLIRTPRLLLRPPFAEDAGEVFAAISRAGIVRMLANAPWPYLPEHAAVWCDRPLDPLALEFVITLPGAAGAPIIGAVGVDASSGELGYWIAEERRGQGYAAEAVEAVLDAAAMLGLSRLDAGHWLDNPASAAVLRHCGFAETGEIRPAHCLGRGGELVLARRYSCDITTRAGVRVVA